MKNLLLALMLLLPFTAAYSQKISTTNAVIISATDPTGNACSATSPNLTYGTGNTRNLYTCQSGVYAVSTGSGSVPDADATTKGKAVLGAQAPVAFASLGTCAAGNRGQTKQLTDLNKGTRTCTLTTGSTYAWVDDDNGVYYLTRFGGGPSASAATNDTALNAILTAIATAGVNSTIYYPDGEVHHSTAFTIGRGVVIQGISGAQGSTPGQGASITHDSNGNLFTWDGTGGSSVGTGGGIRDILITKGDTFSGGTAIKLLATSDSQRPGEMVLDNVLVYGQGTGLWAKGISIDGTAANTPGGRGVRSVHFSKVRVADCTTNNRYIEINQGTHIFGDVQIDQADGTGAAGMTIEGYWDDIMLKVSGGDLIITHTGTVGVDTVTMSLDVNINNFSNTYASALGSIRGKIGNSITNASAYLGIVQQGSALLRDVTLSGGAVTNLSAPGTVTASGNGYQWQHGNTEYKGVLGALSGAGDIFQSYYSYHSATANTLKRSSASLIPQYWKYLSTGGVEWYSAIAGTKNADISNFTKKLSWDTNGNLGVKSVFAETAGAQNAFTARYNSSSERSGLYTNSGGATYFGGNLNYNGGDTYAISSYPAYRSGNAVGSGTYAWYLSVAPSGTAGDTPTFIDVVRVQAVTGVSEFLRTVALTNATVTATSGGTTTLDLSLGNIRTVTMPAGNTTITCSNVPVGFVTIAIIQDSVGSRTVTWNSLFKFSGAVAPTLTTTANARDQFNFQCDGTNCYLLSAVADLR